MTLQSWKLFHFFRWLMTDWTTVILFFMSWRNIFKINPFPLDITHTHTHTPASWSSWWAFPMKPNTLNAAVLPHLLLLKPPETDKKCVAERNNYWIQSFLLFLRLRKKKRTSESRRYKQSSLFFFLLLLLLRLKIRRRGEEDYAGDDFKRFRQYLGVSLSLSLSLRLGGDELS